MEQTLDDNETDGSVLYEALVVAMNVTLNETSAEVLNEAGDEGSGGVNPWYIAGACIAATIVGEYEEGACCWWHHLVPRLTLVHQKNTNPSLHQSVCGARGPRTKMQARAYSRELQKV